MHVKKIMKWSNTTLFITICLIVLFDNCSQSIVQNEIQYRYPMNSGAGWNFRKIEQYHYIKKDSIIRDTINIVSRVTDVITKESLLLYKVEERVGINDSTVAYYFETCDGLYLYASIPGHPPVLSVAKAPKKNTPIDTVVYNPPMLVVPYEFSLNQKWAYTENSTGNTVYSKEYLGREEISSSLGPMTCYKFKTIDSSHDTIISYYNDNGKVFERRYSKESETDWINNQIVTVDTIEVTKTIELKRTW